MTLKEEYENRVSCRSDINEHLPTLKKYSEKCETVVEFGVRRGNSSYGIMMGMPKKLTSYDIVKCRCETDISKLALENNIDYKFIRANTLEISIDKCDMLFIDTLHTYKQLIQELNIHSINVSKYILLHDTVSFGYKDEKNTDCEKKGLNLAISDFLETTADGKNWDVIDAYKNNNGLTVLGRKP